MADLEKRGVIIAQSQKDTKRESITKPRAVLRRNTILPFNAKSGWGTLPSVESINLLEPISVPPHYAPPKPAGFVSRPSRLSWPFSARRASGRNIHLRKIRVPVLSTVIESPKPSPLVPVLSGSLGGDLPSPRKSRSRPTSISSLLKHHPAFRNKYQVEDAEHIDAAHSEPLRRSLTAKPVTKTELRVRLNRSKSVAEMPMSTTAAAVSQLARPKLHARSASMCSQSSGNVPNAVVPPLPLEVARIKSDIRRRSRLSRSPSRLSVSSFESAGSSILITQSSPIMSRSANVRVQKVTRRDWRNSMIVGPRPIRDTLTLHGKNQRSQSSIKSNVARFSSVTPSKQGPSRAEKGGPTLPNSFSMQSINVKTAESVTLSRVSSPTCSPYAVRITTTPKRKSGSYVTAYGSPEERQKGAYILQSVSGNHGGPQRQLSQASTQASSTRSSNGNPFQWDPAPLSSGKPSALKGSPRARKGHRRQNCVRISLVPTTLGPPSRSRSPSPAVMNDIQEESPNATMSEKRSSVGLGFSNNRPLPQPPSTSTFAPDVKFAATSIRASLTHSSPALSLVEYDYGPVDSPLLFNKTACLSRRISTGSVFNISAFPKPCHSIGSVQPIESPPPTFALSRPSNENFDDLRTPDSPFGPSSPFDINLPDSLAHPFKTDKCDPERPHSVYRTPVNSPSARNFPAPFSTIQQKSLIKPERTATYQQLESETSPPLSPKSLPRQMAQEPSAYNLPIKHTTILEEYTSETIDPSIISKDGFTMLNSGFDNRNSSIMNPPKNNRYNVKPIPNSPDTAREMFEPLLEAAFPSSPPTQDCTNLSLPSPSPKRTRSDDRSGRDSSPSSMYSFATLAYSPCIPQAPCSPRPHNATLPTPALNFTNMPMLNPSVGGPRAVPSSPLRSSIQKLRRMNSDAEKNGRGERRYLRLGREDSIALPEEESWLDELSGVDGEMETEEEWDEEKGRRLVGDCLEEWDEEATILELAESQTPTPMRATTSAMCDDVTPTNMPDKQQTNSETSTARGLIPSSPKLGGDRGSSIWEDGEKFWASTPPHPPNSPNKPKQHYLSLSSSPVQLKSGSRKREFEVAKDGDVTNKGQGGDMDEGKNKRRDTHKKRSVLGVSTPNVHVKIQVHPPSGGFTGTPGSLYDQDGFLR
jgi:hypothetical protein